MVEESQEVVCLEFSVVSFGDTRGQAILEFIERIC